MFEIDVHKLRALAFYNKFKDTTENLLILSIYCQKNFPLSKLPDQTTYYSRQIYLHNFTVVKGHSKSPLDQSTVHSYVWTENQYNRDSNTIAPCARRLSSTDMAP